MLSYTSGASALSMSRFFSLSSHVMNVPWWEDLIQWVSQTMAQDDAHSWDHLIRVWHNARLIWKAEDPDDLLWFPIGIAILCHDVINIPKDQEDRALASTRSAEVTVDWLHTHTHLIADQLDLVEEAIRTHSYSSGLTPHSLPAKMVTDADRLDALGAHGIIRVVQVGQSLSRQLYHPDDPLALMRQVDDSTWSVDHFFEKILKVPGHMHTETGRRIASTRAQFVVDFLRQLVSEVGISPEPLEAWSFS